MFGGDVSAEAAREKSGAAQTVTLTNAECDANTGGKGSVSVNRPRACSVPSAVSNSLRPHGPWPPGSSAHGLLQAGGPQWAAIAFSPAAPSHPYPCPGACGLRIPARPPAHASRGPSHCSVAPAALGPREGHAGRPRRQERLGQRCRPGFWVRNAGHRRRDRAPLARRVIQ